MCYLCCISSCRASSCIISKAVRMVKIKDSSILLLWFNINEQNSLIGSLMDPEVQTARPWCLYSPCRQKASLCAPWRTFLLILLTKNEIVNIPSSNQAKRIQSCHAHTVWVCFLHTDKLMFVFFIKSRVEASAASCETSGSSRLQISLLLRLHLHV